MTEREPDVLARVSIAVDLLEDALDWLAGELDSGQPRHTYPPEWSRDLRDAATDAAMVATWVRERADDWHRQVRLARSGAVS